VGVNRRTALEALAALGTAAGASARAQQQPSAPAPGLPPALPNTDGLRHDVRGRMTGARASVAALCAQGTRCVFGVPGAQNNELWDAMKSHGLPYLLVTNESSASVMADASARATGTVGVFAVVPGPGLTNALTGIGEALHDSVPIVGILTDIRRDPGAPIGQVHGLPTAALLRPICKAVFEVRHPAQIPQAIHEAHRVARCGEPGPTAVVIPYNLYTEVWGYDGLDAPPIPPPPSLDEAAYRRALCLLGDRRHRVGIYAGQGTHHATEALVAVAELLQAPVATSVSGKGAVPDAHPLAVGWGYGPFGTRTAETVFRDIDVVLAVGVRYSEVSTANYAIPSHLHLIHVDANPANIGRNVPTSVGVCGDADVFLRRLLLDAEAIRRPPCPALWRRIQGERALERQANARVQVKRGVDPMVFLSKLRRMLDCGDLLCVDVTASVHWAAEVFDVPGPRHFMTPADNQSMGWAMPAAIGAQRVCLERRVVAVTGDGCFLMSGLEASTAARSLLPVKFFVLDDGAYHYMQMLQEPTFGRTTATEIARLDYAAMARGLGLAYNGIAHNGEIAPGIARALAIPGPVLTRVCIGYEGREIRWLEALKKSYLDNLKTGQKVRMGARLLARTVRPFDQND
jgi:acetolactate synthase-1/2/3 large subunit